MAYRALVMVGPPGIGKTTVGKKLDELIPEVLYLSTGNMIRKIIKEDVQPYASDFFNRIKKGRLPDDKDIVAMFQNCLSFAIDEGMFVPEKQVLLLDGIPRTIQQAELLESTLDVMAVYKFNYVQTEMLVERIHGRETRVDDNPEAIKMRIHEYPQITLPVVDFYHKMVAPIINIDARPPVDVVVEQVYRDVKALLKL